MYSPVPRLVFRVWGLVRAKYLHVSKLGLQKGPCAKSEVLCWGQKHPHLDKLDMHIYIYRYKHPYKHAHGHIHTYVHAYLPTCVRIYTHHTYVGTYMHTACMHACMPYVGTYTLHACTSACMHSYLPTCRQTYIQDGPARLCLQRDAWKLGSRSEWLAAHGFDLFVVYGEPQTLNSEALNPKALNPKLDVRSLPPRHDVLAHVLLILHGFSL